MASGRETLGSVNRNNGLIYLKNKNKKLKGITCDVKRLAFNFSF